jgi:hypothetical protein
MLEIPKIASKLIAHGDTIFICALNLLLARPKRDMMYTPAMDAVSKNNLQQ